MTGGLAWVPQDLNALSGVETQNLFRLFDTFSVSCLLPRTCLIRYPFHLEQKVSVFVESLSFGLFHVTVNVPFPSLA